jgi:hypothetical protein
VPEHQPAVRHHDRHFLRVVLDVPPRVRPIDEPELDGMAVRRRIEMQRIAEHLLASMVEMKLPEQRSDIASFDERHVGVDAPR